MTTIRFTRHLMGVLAFSLACTTASAATAPKLAERVTREVRDCRVGGTVRMPVITWGADLVTMLANGDADTLPGSAIAATGMKLHLEKQDDFAEQLKAYLRCDSPFLRGTLGMINQAIDLTEGDPRTAMVVLDQLSWSTGGDALVVKDGITKIEDLKGKTIALQANGPHLDYLATLLAGAGLKPTDVTIRWTKDLTDGPDTPGKALAQADAAFVISPDALNLTLGGKVGTGASDSVKGARILLSTKTANRVIADVIAVRRDWYDANRTQAAALVNALLRSEESARAIMAAKDSPDQRRLAQTAGKILFGSANAASDAAQLWGDAETAGWRMNKATFDDANNPRNFARLNAAAQDALLTLGVIGKQAQLSTMAFDWTALANGLKGVDAAPVARDGKQGQQIAVQMQSQGQTDSATLFAFEINFKPNQSEFPADLYRASFAKVVDLASTFGGALITVEGYADPMKYIEVSNQGNERAATQIWQSSRNLSLNRAIKVREAVIAYAHERNIPMDPAQFATIGMGLMQPKTGMCGQLPCKPRTEAEFLSNMRVRFVVMNVEAESASFNAAGN